MSVTDSNSMTFGLLDIDHNQPILTSDNLGEKEIFSYYIHLINYLAL